MPTLMEVSANARKASDNDKSSITNAKLSPGFDLKERSTMGNQHLVDVEAGIDRNDQHDTTLDDTSINNDKSSITNAKLSPGLDLKERSTMGNQHLVDIEAGIDRNEQHDTTLADTSINWLEVESQCSQSFSSSSSDDCSSTVRNGLKTNRDDYLGSTNNINRDRVTQKVSDKNMDSNIAAFYHSPESVSNSVYQGRNSLLRRVQRQAPDQNRDYEENIGLSRAKSQLDDTTMMEDDTTMLSGSCLDSLLMPNTNKHKSTTIAKTATDFQTEASQHHLGSGTKDGEPPERPRYLEWRQKAECDAFRSKLNQLISDYERHNPHIKLRDYRCMSSNDQQKEERRVIHLLDRLGIRSVSPGEGVEPTENGKTTVGGESRLMVNKDTSIKMMGSPSPDSSRTVERKEIAACAMKQDGTAEKGAAVSEKSTNDFSAILLSPISVDSPKHVQLHENSVRFTAHSPEIKEDSSKNSIGGFGQDDSSSLQVSVEITRGAPSSHSHDSSLFQSPGLEKIQLSKRSKRLATTSGKRGNDLFRTKLNDSSSGSEKDGIASSSQRAWDSSDDSTSLLSPEERRSHPFLASQSPIAGYSIQQGASDTNCSSENNQRKTGRCLSEYSSSDAFSEHRGNDETIESVVTMIGDRQGGRQRLREIPANVALKDGVPFHYNPLHFKRNKRTSRRNRITENQPRHYGFDFSDPLCQYVGKHNEELYCIFEWMYNRDQTATSDQIRNRGNRHPNSDSKGIIFSLNQEQIINITIKLLIEVDSQSSEESSGRYADDSSLSGQTLILVRDKDDIAIWERALREHTPFSVINHTSIPPRDKTRSAIAAKCATFDVVISTYDAAKSPDITTQIDDEGYAVSRNVAESQVDGWMMKRSGSSQTPSQSVAHCKQLSALHRITWRRIIFSDDLGRKSYLTKLGTSRAFAARALNSKSRFAFFTRIEESDLSAFESLIKSNKKAILSVASVLRMELEDAEDGILDVIIDRDQGL